MYNKTITSVSAITTISPVCHQLVLENITNTQRETIVGNAHRGGKYWI